MAEKKGKKSDLLPPSHVQMVSGDSTDIIEKEKPIVTGKSVFSKEEWEWISKHFATIHNVQQQQLDILKSMNTAIQIIGALVLIFAIVTACGGALLAR